MNGFVASWEVRGGKLYLVGVEMACETESTFETMFPDSGRGIFADWVNGELVCSYGGLLKKRNMLDFSVKREHELILTVENGVLKSADKRGGEYGYKQRTLNGIGNNFMPI
jgi:hypothetical protein